MSNPPSHQVIILDVNPFLWNRRRGAASNDITFTQFIGAVQVFAKSHLMLNKHNTVHIIAALPSSYTVLVSNSTNGNDSRKTYFSGDFDLHKIVEKLWNSLTSEPEWHVGEGTAKTLAQALSQSLCGINRMLHQNPLQKSKILCLQISLDAPSSYNSIMNSIFSAQKFGIPVDAMIFSDDDSSFMEQACLLTGGIYSKPICQGDALQLLLIHFLPCCSSRQILRSPIPNHVDFKASCTCHNKSVDFTFMCSVCLSLFCPTAIVDDKCEICRTKVR